MIKLSKRLSVLMLTIFIALCTSMTVSAEALYKLSDIAELFTDDEYAVLEEKLNEVSEYTGWDVAVYTNERNVSKSNMEDVCNGYYDASDYGTGVEKSGVLLTVDMASREMFVLTKGEAMEYFTDQRVDEILDDVVYYLSDDMYVEAVNTFADDVKYFYDSGIPSGGTYENVDLEDEETGNLFLLILKKYGIIAGVIGVVAGVLSVVYVKSHYKNHGKSGTYDLAQNSVTNLTYKEDIFLHKSVSVTTVSSSSSGSRSSGRSGGSRSSHGGGGRSF